ncbi:cation efflux system protein CusB [Geobacter sp. OR-1]|uniref:efflux RND transporter periplasmic adaptor subunit n=1 Tax=Geobacter sp. OR-1 TaxID=1266765 RepID=UPI0005432546|nr:efflux RND transporter periplasmic adaptor subunit [Geobacter sp. OR-1]GAM07873.1 cation efflux system protein CusB [Geobacter sp. OR-1]
MKTRTVIIFVAVCAFLAFLAGAWVSFQTRPQKSSASRKILYYIDPMHPSYKSDKPGIAPDCGMQLEPVYDNGSVGGGTSSGAIPPGNVQVSPEKQQAIGVIVAAVERSGGTHFLRVPGRVFPDERKVYRLTASVSGWVQRIGKATTGDRVGKNETLLSFYAPDFLAAVQSYIFALGSLDRSMAAQGKNSVNQMDVNNMSLHNYRNTLRNLGMSDLQIDEIAKTRQPTENIRVAAPAEGLVIARNVYPGLKFEAGTEFFRIADLSKVWVLADTYGSEADKLVPGTPVKVSIPNRNRNFMAKVSNVPPIFDPASRTLKVRLELDNPGYLLRPEMYVDVELPVTSSPMLSVPSEALLDSGLKKTVFVEKSAGIFEPREVETGQHLGNRVEIVSGLKEGERIAISGTFLLDSESRMKAAASGISGTPRQDPVCSMYVDEAKARTKGLVIESGGKALYFCSEECLGKFRKPAGPKPALVKANSGAKPTTQPNKAMGHSDHTTQDKQQAVSPAAESDHSGHEMHGGIK